jgi:hypothetical protein
MDFLKRILEVLSLDIVSKAIESESQTDNLIKIICVIGGLVIIAGIVLKK